jgi:hypothetical protein
MAALVASYGYIGPEVAPESWAPDGLIDSLPGVLDWLPDIRLTPDTHLR